MNNTSNPLIKMDFAGNSISILNQMDCFIGIIVRILIVEILVIIKIQVVIRIQVIIEIPIGILLAY